MLIGLISDTHIPLHVPKLPFQELKDAFEGVQLILHAGDIYDISVLDELELIAPVLAAKGDDDPLATAQDKRVKFKQIIKAEGITIWLSHQMPWSWSTPKSGNTPDVFVFGHTHDSLLVRHDGTLSINPGSATFPRYHCELGTVGLLSVEKGTAEARIVQLK